MIILAMAGIKRYWEPTEPMLVFEAFSDLNIPSASQGFEAECTNYWNI